MYPQGVQSPQALTNRGAIRSHTRTRRFLGTFLRSVPLLVARRGVIPWDNTRFLSRLNAISVRQPRTERVVPNGTTSESKPTDRNTRLTFFVRRPASGVRQYNCLHSRVCRRTVYNQMMTALYPLSSLLRSFSARADCGSLREGA